MSSLPRCRPERISSSGLWRRGTQNVDSARTPWLPRKLSSLSWKPRCTVSSPVKAVLSLVPHQECPYQDGVFRPGSIRGGCHDHQKTHLRSCASGCTGGHCQHSENEPHDMPPKYSRTPVKPGVDKNRSCGTMSGGKVPATIARIAGLIQAHPFNNGGEKGSTRARKLKSHTEVARWPPKKPGA